MVSMRDFLKFRLGPALGFLTLNVSAVYCLVTGKMVGMLGTIVEGRHSSPILYWIYMSFLWAGAAVVDVTTARTVIADNPRRVVPDQSKGPTA